MMYVLPVLLATLGSLCLAYASVLQHEGVRRVGCRRGLGGAAAGRLARDRTWSTGAALLAAGMGLHAVAVVQAPVSLVQPIGVLAVPMALYLRGRRSGDGVPGARYRPAWLTVGGTSVFVVTAALSLAEPGPVTGDALGPLLATLVPLVAILAVLGWVGPAGAHGLALSAGAGVAFGLGTALVRSVAVLVRDTGLTRPGSLAVLVVVAAACYAGGSVLVQQGYLVGTPEGVVGTLTVVDPATAVLVGMLVLGEGEALSRTVLGLMLTGGVAAAVGVALLSRPAPATEHTEHTEHPDGDHDPIPVPDAPPPAARRPPEPKGRLLVDARR